MKNRIRTFPCLLVVALLVGVSTTALAQDENEGVAVTFHFVVKDGMEESFESAVKQYHDLLKDKPGRWSYTYFNAVTGPNTGDYYARSSNHNWADLDVTHPWDEEAGDAFRVMVEPFLESTERIISVNRKEGHPPESMDDVKFVNVTDWHILPGMGGEFDTHLKTITDNLNAAGWGGDYLFFYAASGGTGNVVSIAGFNKNWADMAPKSPSFGEVMIKQMGEKKMKETMKAFGSTFEVGSTVTYAVRPDLSY